MDRSNLTQKDRMYTVLKNSIIVRAVLCFTKIAGILILLRYVAIIISQFLESIPDERYYKIVCILAGVLTLITLVPVEEKQNFPVRVQINLINLSNQITQILTEYLQNSINEQRLAELAVSDNELLEQSKLKDQQNLDIKTNQPEQKKEIRPRVSYISRQQDQSEQTVQLSGGYISRGRAQQPRSSLIETNTYRMPFTIPQKSVKQDDMQSICESQKSSSISISFSSHSSKGISNQKQIEKVNNMPIFLEQAQINQQDEYNEISND